MKKATYRKLSYYQFYFSAKKKEYDVKGIANYSTHGNFCKFPCIPRVYEVLSEPTERNAGQLRHHHSTDLWPRRCTSMVDNKKHCVLCEWYNAANRYFKCWKYFSMPLYFLILKISSKRKSGLESVLTTCCKNKMEKGARSMLSFLHHKSWFKTLVNRKLTIGM